MIGVAAMAEEHRFGANGVAEVPCYRLTDITCSETCEIDADDLVRIVGVELSFIDWAIETDGAFENGCWRVEPA